MRRALTASRHQIVGEAAGVAEVDARDAGDLADRYRQPM